MTSATHPLDSFEQDLLAEMRSVVSARAGDAAAHREPPARRARPALVVAAAGALVAGVSAALLTGGSPAFAVATTDDGSIVVSISELTDSDGLEAALAEHGVSAEVVYAGDGSAVSIDPGGWVDVGTTSAGPDIAPTDPTRMDLTWAGGEGAAAADPAASCGGSDGAAPITLERDGSGYVVTLAGPTLGQDNGLRLSTVTGPGGDSLFASYSYGAFVCGAGVSG